jgi:hypothetical protein
MYDINMARKSETVIDHYLNPIVVLSFLAKYPLYPSHHLLFTMGNCLFCISVYSDIDAMPLDHMRSRNQSLANYFRHTEESRLHNEKNCPYPLPNDLTEIDR